MAQHGNILALQTQVETTQTNQRRESAQESRGMITIAVAFTLGYCCGWLYPRVRLILWLANQEPSRLDLLRRLPK